MGRYEHTQDPTQGHVYAEKLKLAQAVESGSEQTHPEAVSSFPLGDGTDAMF
jgi:hypothetical protein